MSTDPATAPSSGSVSAMTLDNYRLPAHRLQMQQREQDRIPLVLVACGSFSPVTILHLRLLEMGRDHFRMNTQYEVVGGYFSPVSDVYRKNGLAPSHHRVRMCELATEESPDWIMVDPWEALQPRYTPTAAVLDRNCSLPFISYSLHAHVARVREYA
jgi:nicotinamide mononucleotide adenylyltransferase